MTIAMALAAAFSFATGYGEWKPGATGQAALTRDEEEYVERVIHHLNDCGDADCRQRAALSIAEIINLRRALNNQFIGATVFDALRRPCDSMDADLPAQLECFRQRKGITFEEGMRLAGFRRAGITREGYLQLRSGLRMKEVEFILGRQGEEISYAASGGYSAATYRWVVGRRMIVLSFANSELTGRSQSGLF